jgi:hypothetical protein
MLGREEVVEAERSTTETLQKTFAAQVAQLKSNLRPAGEGRTHPPPVAIVIKVDEI